MKCHKIEKHSKIFNVAIHCYYIWKLFNTQSLSLSKGYLTLFEICMCAQVIPMWISSECEVINVHSKN